MSSDIERFMATSTTPDRHNRAGYVQPAWWTNAGQLDRRSEARQTDRMRQLHRDAEYALAAREAELLQLMKEIDVRQRANVDAKFALHNARRASQVLSDEDPELVAKFALIDDDLFQGYRMLLGD